MGEPMSRCADNGQRGPHRRSVVDVADDIGPDELQPVNHLNVVPDQLVRAEDDDRSVGGADQLGGVGDLQQSWAVDQHDVEA